jgi:putative oxidoreductase
MNEVVGSRLGALPKGGAGKALNVVSWVVQILAALMFLMAGSNKLRGAPEMVGLFETIGIGQWFRYLTGGLEVIGAVLLLVPWLSAYGAALLVPVMIGAVATHLFVIGGNPTMALVLLAAVLFVAWVRRGTLAAAFGRASR